MAIKTEDYMGLTKKKAQDKAEDHGLIFRLIRIDERNFFDYPEDIRTDRICVEVDKGFVTKATIQ